MSRIMEYEHVIYTDLNILLVINIHNHSKIRVCF